MCAGRGAGTCAQQRRENARRRGEFLLLLQRAREYEVFALAGVPATRRQLETRQRASCPRVGASQEDSRTRYRVDWKSNCDSAVRAQVHWTPWRMAGVTHRLGASLVRISGMRHKLPSSRDAVNCEVGGSVPEVYLHAKRFDNLSCRMPSAAQRPFPPAFAHACCAPACRGAC